jgi:thioredoxin-related protein
MPIRAFLALFACVVLMYGCQQPATGPIDSASGSPALASNDDAVGSDQSESTVGQPRDEVAISSAPKGDSAEAAPSQAPSSAPPAKATELEWQADWASARRVASEHGKPIMVDFYTDWCYWCKRLERDTYPDRDVARLSDRQVSLKLNAEREGRELARKHGVRSYPTIVYFDPQGKEIGRVAGYLAAPQSIQAVKPILERFERR